MLRRTLVGLTVIATLALAACQPTATTTPAPAAPTGIVLQPNQNQSTAPGAQLQPQAQPQAPAGQAQPPAAQPQSPQATPAPSFLQGSEQARGQVYDAPRSPNSNQGEVRPTTEPERVKALGPATPSQNRILYVRGGRIWTATADGKDRKSILDDKVPSLWSPPKDPGRAWVSPSGKWVTYYAGSAGAVWLTDIDSGASRQLIERGIPAPNTVNDKEADKVTRKLMEQEVAWSPDESQFALLAAPQGQIDVYLFNLKSNQVTQVSNDTAIHSELTWSPKGDALAFRSRDESVQIEKLYILRGQQLLAVATDRIAKVVNESELGGILTLTWVDDTHLVFYPVSGALQSLGIWVCNVADGSLTPLYNKQLTSPDYSKAAKRWAFTSTDNKNTLYILDWGATDARMLLPEGGLAPLFTPDGKQVIYSADNGETYDIHIINLDGSGERTLAKGVNLIGDNPPEPSPAGKRYFSPDGKWLVYAAVGADYGTTGNNLENWWAVPLDGSQPAVPLTDIPKIFYIRQLAASPDQVAYAFTGLRYADRATHLWTFSRNGGGIVKVDAEVRWFRWLGPSTGPKTQ